MDKTAKIYIMGAAAVLVSGVKLEDWKRVEKYASDSLAVEDEHGNVDFRIQVGESGGSVTEEGVCWGSYTSDEGYATVTILLDESVDNKKEAVTNVIGTALLRLLDIEKKLPEILEEIRMKEEKIGDQIILI